MGDSCAAAPLPGPPVSFLPGAFYARLLQPRRSLLARKKRQNMVKNMVSSRHATDHLST